MMKKILETRILQGFNKKNLPMWVGEFVKCEKIEDWETIEEWADRIWFKNRYQTLLGQKGYRFKSLLRE
jgi:hypothetical protein